MKKFFLLMAMTITLATTAMADTFNWGINAGMNITKTDADGWTSDATNGWYLGVITRFKVPILNFGVDAALNYSQERISNGDEINGTFKYINIPVHLRYDFALPIASNVLCPYLLAGPQFNYSVNKFKEGTVEFKSTDAWKLDLGLGAIIADHLQVTYTYSIPMGKTVTAKESITNLTDDAKVNTHRIGVAYFF